ncbi:MAG: prenyltransferase/squalene oxidase repeat-containing protein, partial [Bacillota bacterium]
GYHNSAVEEALKWLLLQQSGSGNWGSNTNTAWTMLALLEEGNHDEELKEAANYLEQLINKNGSWGIYPGQKANNFSSGLVMLALQKYNPTSETLEDGLAYLDQLVGDKLYIDQAFRYYNLAEINYLLEDYSDFNAGNISWLTDFADQKNYDYLARRISIGVQAGEDVSDLVNQLLAGQQRNGGWGFKKGQESNVWDTTLALRALLDAGYTNSTVYAQAGGYLQQEQKDDGSFTVQSDEEGSIYLTTMATEELDRLSDRLNVGPITSQARSWLLTQRNSSGSYGDSSLETARALCLTYKQLSQSEIDATLKELKNNRLADGSWDNDALTTAAAIEAILEVK